MRNYLCMIYQVIQHKFIDKDHSVEAKDGAYGKLQIKQPKTSGASWEPALPNSVVKEDNQGKIIHTIQHTVENIHHHCNKQRSGESKYEPPLPNSMLEIKSSRGKHSTEKPVALMEWVLKYYSKEGDTILDPTMGSGSTGIACKNMGRNFIGIEMDGEIFEFAKERIGV